MEKLDFSRQLNFDNVDLTAPNIVIENIVSQIKDATNEIITGNVEPYKGLIFSNNNTHVVASIQAALAANSGSVDIQEKLGKQGEEDNKYEVYLTTPVFNQYKYRICFIQYGVANYPVTVVLQRSIAIELKDILRGRDYIFKCDNRPELEELINVYQIHKEDTE